MGNGPGSADGKWEVLHVCAAVQERKHDEPQRVGVACSVSLSALGWLLIRSAQSAGEERTKEERSEARRKTQELLRGDGSSVEEATQAHRREWHGLSRSFFGARSCCQALSFSFRLHFLHASRFRAKKHHNLIYGHYLICIIATKPALPARSDAILLWTRARCPPCTCIP